MDHDPFDASALAADGLIVLEDGRIADSIPVEELRSHCPQSKLLAEWRKHMLESGSGSEPTSSSALSSDPVNLSVTVH